MLNECSIFDGYLPVCGGPCRVFESRVFRLKLAAGYGGGGSKFSAFPIIFS